MTLHIHVALVSAGANTRTCERNIVWLYLHTSVYMYTYCKVYVLPQTRVCMVCTYVLICKHHVAFDACTSQVAMDAELMQPDLHTMLYCFHNLQLSCIIAFSVPCLTAG